MKTYKIGVMYGDGIGPEIMKATMEVLEEVKQKGFTLQFETLPMGLSAIESHCQPLPQITKDSLKEKDGWIMGPHNNVAYPKQFSKERNPSGELRHYFDMFANIRPAKTIPGIERTREDADIVIYRENTEGYYPDRNMYQGIGEFMPTEDVVITTGVFTRQAIERIAEAAFQAAMNRKKKVTIVHKANVLRFASGMFKNICYEVAEKYPEVEVNDVHIDAMAALLVRDMTQFDVIVTENMFGDILSDLTSELVGGLGLAPSINANEKQAMAQAVHGSAPDIAGQGIANPVGMMLSAKMLFEWLAQKHEDVHLLHYAQVIERSIYETIAAGFKTPDLGGIETTASFTERVIENVRGISD